MWRMQGGQMKDGTYIYDDIIEHLIRLIPSKYEKIKAEREGRKPDTPTQARVPRSYGQIKS